MATEPRAGEEHRPLDRFLRARIAGLEGSMRLESAAGGRSNPTYFLSYGEREFVLRKKPPGKLLQSAHAIDREFRVLKALEGSAVPVPKALLFEEDPSIVGTPFYLMDRVRGRVFEDPTLPGVPPADRRRMLLESAEVLGRLHGLPWVSLGLEGFGRQGNYYARQIARWSRQWTRSRTRDLPAVDALAVWLQANVPGSAGASIVHGDYRPNNLIFHPQEPCIVAVLDWELCTIGDPLADVAWFTLLWRLDASDSLGFSDSDLPALGIPIEGEWLDHYGRFAPSGERPSAFHTAFALFRLAVIAEGVGHRAKHGMAASDDAARFGTLGAVFARRGIEVIERA